MKATSFAAVLDGLAREITPVHTGTPAPNDPGRYRDPPVESEGGEL